MAKKVVVEPSGPWIKTVEHVGGPVTGKERFYKLGYEEDGKINFTHVALASNKEDAIADALEYIKYCEEKVAAVRESIEVLFAIAFTSGAVSIASAFLNIPLLALASGIVLTISSIFLAAVGE